MLLFQTLSTCFLEMIYSENVFMIMGCEPLERKRESHPRRGGDRGSHPRRGEDRDLTLEEVKIEREVR